MHHIKKIFIITFFFSGFIFSSSTNDEKKSLSQEIDTLEQEYISIINSSDLNTQKKLQALSFLKVRAKNILEKPDTLEKLLLLISAIIISVDTYSIFKLNKENSSLNDIYEITEQKNNPSYSAKDAKKIEAFEKKHKIIYKKLDCDECNSTENDDDVFSQKKVIQTILEGDYNENFCDRKLKNEILNLLSNTIFNIKKICKNDDSCKTTKLQNFIENKASENEKSLEACYGGYIIASLLAGYSLYNLFNISHQKSRLIKLIENIEALELSLTHKN